jgi:flagellar biosynthesis GTPase FlhF
MKLKTYVGRSLEELAPQIRDELGAGAVILSQRQGLKGGVGGFFGTKSIEVLAADRMPTAEEQAGLAASPEMTGPSYAAPKMAAPVLPQPEAVLETDAERKALVTAALGEIKARQMPASQAVAAYAPRSEELALPDFAGSIGPVDLPVIEADVSEPIVVEHNKAETGMHLGPRRPANPAPLLPPVPERAPDHVSNEAFAVLHELDFAGVEPDIARAIVESAERHLRPFQPEALLRDLVRARIRSVVRVESGWGGSGQRTLAVAGPVGSGKTTVLRKLAERYCAAGLSVGIISLEPETALRRGADALDDSVTFDLRRAGSVSAVRAARRAFADYDAVLVDTPGAALDDSEHFEKLRVLLAECGVGELHAVLPIAIDDRELEHVLDRLIVELGANRIVATRLDESRCPGALLNISANAQLPLAYLSTGSVVPDDLEVADGGSICDRILPI